MRRCLVSAVMLWSSSFAAAGENPAPPSAASTTEQRLMRAVFAAETLEKLRTMSGNSLAHLIDAVALEPAPTDASRLREQFPARVKGPDAVKNPPGPLPSRLRVAGVNTSVRVYAVVGTAGRVGEIYVTEFAASECAQAAAIGVKRWEFPPRETPALLELPMVFRFDTQPGKAPVREQRVSRPDLRAELLQRQEEDQAVRKLWAEQRPTRGDDPLILHGQAIDRANTAWLKGVIAEHGWLGPEMVGSDGVSAAWLLIQHADHDREFQRAMLPLIEAAFRAGKVRGSNYALLVDRVRIGEGKPQLYGSQITTKNGEPAPHPIEDEANVDQRRADVGLEPLADYVARFKDRAAARKGK